MRVEITGNIMHRPRKRRIARITVKPVPEPARRWWHALINPMRQETRAQRWVALAGQLTLDGIEYRIPCLTKPYTLDVYK